jgi:hypothetical protein
MFGIKMHLATAIAKDGYPRMFLQVVIGHLCSIMSLQDGKDPHQTLIFSVMHGIMVTFHFHSPGSSLQMLDLQTVICWCVLIMLSAIIWKSKHVPTSGEFLLQHAPWISVFNSPKDYKELFNLRHAQARNIIERIFGIFKRRFKLLHSPAEYSIQMQDCLVLAQCALFNFIQRWSPTEIDGDLAQSGDHEANTSIFGGSDDGASSDEDTDSVEAFGDITPEESARAAQRRDSIAKAMWEQYENYLAIELREY